MTAVVARGKARVGTWLRTARGRSPAFDHMVRAYKRFSDQNGTMLAGSVTYFGFLSFFPLLAVAFAILVYVVVVYPDARAQVENALQSTFPGLIGTGEGRIDLSKTTGAGVGVGIIGLAGLIYSGTGWIDALRDALRSMWLQPPDKAPNIVIKKLLDLVVLVAFGVALVASVSFSSLATSATRLAVDAVGGSHVTGMGVTLRILAIVVAVAFDSVVFALLFGVLPGVRSPLRLLVRGAVLGAIGFEVLKLIGTWLIGRTTSNPVYGAFAIMVGLLIWINFVSRVTLLAAAWTATGIPPEPEADEHTEELPEEVAERLQALPFAKLRRELDYEALRYREEKWLAERVDKADWPVGEAGRIRAVYMHELAERARAVGVDTDVVATQDRPGSLRDLAHQVRVARRAKSRALR
ncbi:MAG: YihY/virulence factor BrkB family protein [Streptosporangiales bacterium]|nr:YihY/virulence factor BrkB family protein [Streptosporangiales bacterium]MBO0892429.1 YihY/virulence factor BrkB family protein [Acidothermales bacterium]